jgi:hypothetical protein
MTRVSRVGKTVGPLTLHQVDTRFDQPKATFSW